MMRIAIFGAGAIGGYVAAKLAAAGRVDLSIVARGEHLKAIEANGLRLIEDGRETAVSGQGRGAGAMISACRTMSCSR